MPKSKRKNSKTDDKDQSLHSILIVDDDPICRKALQLLLEKMDYNVFCATNGREAYSSLTEHFDETNRHVIAIISDVMMPVEDGITFLEDVKANKYFQNVPFICISSSKDRVFINDAKRFGADAFLSKPIALEQLELILSDIDNRQRDA